MVRIGTATTTPISSLASSMRMASTEAMVMSTITEETKLKAKMVLMIMVTATATQAGPTNTTTDTRVATHMRKVTGGAASKRTSSRAWSLSTVMIIAGRISSNKGTQRKSETA